MAQLSHLNILVVFAILCILSTLENAPTSVLAGRGLQRYPEGIENEGYTSGGETGGGIHGRQERAPSPSQSRSPSRPQSPARQPTRHRHSLTEKLNRKLYKARKKWDNIPMTIRRRS
uniref:Secreted protein n=1 Tax=Rhipicephalus appendiculatus TaxID=34631 RepID=A0A131YFX1_RHIAP